LHKEKKNNPEVNMTIHKRRRHAWLFAGLVTIAFILPSLNSSALVTSAIAQTTKASILGRIIDERGKTVHWELPFGKGRKIGAGHSGVAEKIISGWGAGGILVLQTGVPFNATLGFDNIGIGNTNAQAQRSNLAPGRDFDSVVTGDPNGYVDPAAFELQLAGFYGNLGRNTLGGPNLWSFSTYSMSRISPRQTPEIARYSPSTL
jgi:hypothetical protein